MDYKIIPTSNFKKEAKRLLKKYPSLKEELYSLYDSLSKTPNLGTLIFSNTYKIRLAIKSKHKGKSGGARVLTYLINENKEVYLLSIYDKAEFDTITDQTLKLIIESINS